MSRYWLIARGPILVGPKVRISLERIRLEKSGKD